MGKITTIVAGIAEAEAEDPRLARAVALASSLDADLHLVHAYAFPDPILYPEAGMPIFTPEQIEERDEAIRGLLEKRVREIAGGERIHYHVRSAPAALAILDAADETDADLILVGASRHGPFVGAILGTTTQRVTRTARVPVLVVRRPEQTVPRRVLFTTDLSELSEDVYERGVEIVTALGPPDRIAFRGLLVVDYDTKLPPSREDLERMARARLETFLRRTPPRGGPRGVAVEGKVRYGVPAREILGEAKEWRADVLVLGTHGRSGAARFLIGSVAEAVLRRAPCDALVIPNAPERASRGTDE